MTLTTQEDYVCEEGNFCPVCQSENTESIGAMEREEGYCTNQVECHDCGSLWEEVFSLKSFKMLETALFMENKTYGYLYWSAADEAELGGWILKYPGIIFEAQKHSGDSGIDVFLKLPKDQALTLLGYQPDEGDWDAKELSEKTDFQPAKSLK